MRLALFSLFILLLSCNHKPDLPAGFHVENGFDLTFVAGEPLIFDPVDLVFDQQGRAFVLEMPGYPMEDAQSRIVLLGDSNGDKVYDERKVFAEGLGFATSILPFKNGFLVAAPPYLVHVSDTDGDHHGEKVDTLMGGFANENLQHNFNGLTYGIDNWIYIANGGNSGKPYWWNDTTTQIDLRDDDLRIDPDQRIMERIGESSGGFGLGMDAFGRLFETHNLTHVSHLVFPSRYFKDTNIGLEHTLENISDHEENGLARIYPVGEQESRVNHPEQSGYFSGSCGILWYDGSQFGEEYEGTVWVADVVLNLIHVDRIEAHGASFRAKRVISKRDFLASEDRSFRPVKLISAPDGTIYVLDMHRKVIEHPEWIPDEMEKDMDIDAGKDQGRIYSIARGNRSGRESDFQNFATSERLVGALGHPNIWVRKTAHRLIMEKQAGDEIFNRLAGLLNSTKKFERLHGMWIMARKSKLKSDDLKKMLNDSDAGIRENALIVAEDYVNNERDILASCVKLMNDESQRVRMQAALTLSTLSKQNFDKNKDSLMDGVKNAMTKPIDKWNVAALTLLLKHDAGSIVNVLVDNPTPARVQLLASLAEGTSETGRALALLGALRQTTLHDSIKRTILMRLARANFHGINTATLRTPISQVESTANQSLLSPLMQLREKLGLPPSQRIIASSRSALASLKDTTLILDKRLELIDLVKWLPYEAKAEVLFDLLESTTPIRLQEASLKQLGSLDNKSVGPKLVNSWKNFSPHIRRLASDILLYRKSNHDALLTGLENGDINIGEMNFDLERRRTLLWWSDNDDTKRRAAKLFNDSGVVTRKEAIDKMKEALTLKGNIENGKQVFIKICSQCHVFGKEGMEVGPILTEIGRKSKETIMHDILDPNAAVDTKYINHKVETTSGEIHIGIVDAESDQGVIIKKIGGEKVSIPRNEIKKLSSLGTSLMMEGLENSLSHQEMADLLSYMQEAGISN